MSEGLECDATAEELHKLRSQGLATHETRQRNQDGPVVAEGTLDELTSKRGLRLVEGRNARGRRFVAIYDGAERRSNWVRA